MKTRLMFAVVFLSFLMLGFGVQFSSATKIDCWVRVIPEQPTECDDVNVAVELRFNIDAPRVHDWGTIQREGNTFFVNVTVWVPAKDILVPPAISNESFSYRLGRLRAGEYSFKVYVQTIGGSNDYWLICEKSFTVSSSDDKVVAPELPNISYALVLLALTLMITALLKASKRKH